MADDGKEKWAPWWVYVVQAVITVGLVAQVWELWGWDGLSLLALMIGVQAINRRRKRGEGTPEYPERCRLPFDPPTE